MLEDTSLQPEMDVGVVDGANLPAKNEQDVARPKSKMSIYSKYSSVSMGSIKSILNEKVARKVLNILKLVGIMSPLIGALLALATISMIQARTELATSNKLVENMENGEKIRLVVDSLQRERGMSCVLMNSLKQEGEAEAKGNVLRFRGETDALWDKLDKWEGDDRIRDKGDFVVELAAFRNTINVTVFTCTNVLEYYTDLIDHLLISMFTNFPIYDPKNFLVAYAYYSLLKMKDLIGLQRATGGGFFAASTYDDVTFRYFIGLTETIKYLRHIASESMSLIDEKMQLMELQNAPLLYNLQTMEVEIFSGNKSEHTADMQTSHAWFFNMTDYIKLYSVIETEISKEISQRLMDVSSSLAMDFNIALGIVIVMLIICPPAITWYILSYEKLMGKIRKFTMNIQNKKNELAKEKQKTEMLLHQLLPKSIAHELLAGRTVAPEYFESVTVFFSDIKGFTSLSSRSTPLQITEFLNTLYSKCDSILELYDCYKVEIIGDSYLVASGLPLRNTTHSCQISTMALHFLRMMHDFTIPHRPTEHVLMRIGCHTGSVAAGVVGLKMPRYCLFGDTVNTGSRMESTGYPNRIQISQHCKEHLEFNAMGQFEIQYRETINVKGKGEMETFWVLSKKGFPFGISLEETKLMMEEADYWRTGKDGLK